MRLPRGLLPVRLVVSKQTRRLANPNPSRHFVAEPAHRTCYAAQAVFSLNAATHDGFYLGGWRSQSPATFFSASCYTAIAALGRSGAAHGNWAASYHRHSSDRPLSCGIANQCYRWLPRCGPPSRGAKQTLAAQLGSGAAISLSAELPARFSVSAIESA